MITSLLGSSIGINSDIITSLSSLLIREDRIGNGRMGFGIGMEMGFRIGIEIGFEIWDLG
uniref:Uncharacterized protein n=1 Tax=Rhizophagus irregularis (strain DAOM 181602 / DAOM 197198 / MUCL 43194) TaxID=747089 RepID=U9UH86_RHIID